MKSAQDVSDYGDVYYRGVDSHSKLDSDSKFDSHSKLDFHSKMCSSFVFLVLYLCWLFKCRYMPKVSFSFYITMYTKVIKHLSNICISMFML